MSYLEHFKLKEQPFRLTPDPAFVYWSKQHSRAKAYMESTIWLADGFVIITGEIGSGKTTLLQSFLEELDDSVVYAVVSQTQLTATEFLQATLTEFGFKPFDKRKVELLDMLNMFLIEQYANDKKVVLIVPVAKGTRRNPHAVEHRDAQGKSVAHHPGRTAGTKRETRLSQAQAACPARSPAVPPRRAG
jgi:type II secretory pathway predicted ATPase ExeA